MLFFKLLKTFRKREKKDKKYFWFEIHPCDSGRQNDAGGEGVYGERKGVGYFVL